jgi:hypothetical protein
LLAMKKAKPHHEDGVLLDFIDPNTATQINKTARSRLAVTAL